MITDYKAFFQNEVDEDFAQEAKTDPIALVNWIKANIVLNNDLNPQRIPIMPTGVWKARVSDILSRDIFFISLARSLGIPARIEPVARKTQFYKEGEWIDVDFEAQSQSIARQGKVVASYHPIKSLANPKYYSHFTISKVLADGTLQTLNFQRNANVDMGLGNTWAGILKQPLSLDEGNYMLVSGMRMANGSVLARMSFFNVEADKTTKTELVMRESADDVQVIGSMDAEGKFKRADNGEEVSILTTTGRGYFIVGILGARQEPTNHAMRDIAQFANDFEDWGRSMVLLFKDEQGWKNFDTKEFGTLPQTITYGIDMNQTITNMLVKGANLPNANTLPIFVIADTFGRIVFVSQGYTIGLGEQMMKVIHKL